MLPLIFVQGEYSRNAGYDGRSSSMAREPDHTFRVSVATSGRSRYVALSLTVAKTWRGPMSGSDSSRTGTS